MRFSCRMLRKFEPALNIAEVVAIRHPDILECNARVVGRHVEGPEIFARSSTPGALKESMTNLKVAFSPCPNDTFIFHAWLKGLISSPINIQPVLEDVQTLNELAMQKRYPVSKISCYCLGLIEDEYQMLSSGAALGYGCGPKIIAKDKFPLEELGSKRIAIPGRQTTAHFLLDLLAPKPIEKRFCSYNEIADLIRSGAVDCGLIIHESRFTFAAQGFNEIPSSNSNTAMFWCCYTNR